MTTPPDDRGLWISIGMVLGVLALAIGIGIGKLIT